MPVIRQWHLSVLTNFCLATLERLDVIRLARAAEGAREARSPDGKWTAFVKDYNVWVRGADGKEAQVSEGGLSAIVTADLQVGESVEASFEMQPGQRITVHGAVRNKAQFRYGLEFMDLSEDIRVRIQKACASLPLYTGGWY